MYFDKLDDIVNKYNNTYPRTINMESADVENNIYIDFGQEKIIKITFKIGDHERISKCKNIFAKGYTPNLSEEIFVTKKVKNTVPWTYIINDLNGEEVIGTFYGKELQKTNEEEFKTQKIIKKKRDKLYVKGKGYDNSFNSWIDKKDIV